MESIPSVHVPKCHLQLVWDTSRGVDSSPFLGSYSRGHSHEEKGRLSLAFLLAWEDWIPLVSCGKWICREMFKSDGRFTWCGFVCKSRDKKCWFRNGIGWILLREKWNYKQVLKGAFVKKMSYFGETELWKMDCSRIYEGSFQWLVLRYL